MERISRRTITTTSASICSSWCQWKETGGFALIEAIVSTVIAVIAVMGLAYSFSVGRVQIDRFEVARAALASAQDRMERLSVLDEGSPQLAPGEHPPLELAPREHPPLDFVHEGVVMGHETWIVDWVDDPGLAGLKDLKRVTVEVSWTQGPISDRVRLSRLFIPQ